MRFSKVLPASLLILLGAPLGNSQDKPTLIDPRGYLAELRRLAAKRPFLQDSPDVHLESQSLGKFFTREIYQKLRGNAYFGYEHDEGFRMEGKEIQIEVLKDLAPGQPYQAAYRLALEQSLKAAAFEPKPATSHQVGLRIVGVEPKETAKTLPGVMVEVYLRNSRLKKSLFIRYGSGHPRGLPAAIRLSAEMLVRNSLRMNPKWIIVGEVRGAEALDLVRAFNTGHYGAGTIHANSSYDALLAVESLILQSGLDVSARAVKELVARAIQIVIQVTHLPDHSRKVVEMAEVEGLDYDRSIDFPPYKLRSLYLFQFSHYDEEEKARGEFVSLQAPSWLADLKLIPNYQVPSFWKEQEAENLDQKLKSAHG